VFECSSVRIFRRIPPGPGNERATARCTAADPLEGLPRPIGRSVFLGQLVFAGFNCLFFDSFNWPFLVQLIFGFNSRFLRQLFSSS